MSLRSALVSRIPRSLRWRLALPVVSLLSAVLLVYGATTALQQSSTVAGMLNARAQNLARSVAAASVGQVLMRDLEALEQLLIGNLRYGRVQAVQIVDARGRLVADVEMKDGKVLTHFGRTAPVLPPGVGAERTENVRELSFLGLRLHRHDGDPVLWQAIQWQLIETADGYYTTRSKTNKYLKLIDRRNRDGGTVSFATNAENDANQKWHLIKLTNDARRTTSFIPENHGFRFVNTFNGEDTIRWGGLCGGMVYSALDYFRNRMPIPAQTYTPANATTLQSYIYQRRQHSMWNVNEKWSELEVAYNFRAGEIFRWGIQGTGGGRLEELKNAIDAGRSVPIGLVWGRSAQH